MRASKQPWFKDWSEGLEKLWSRKHDQEEETSRQMTREKI